MKRLSAIISAVLLTAFIAANAEAMSDAQLQYWCSVNLSMHARTTAQAISVRTGTPTYIINVWLNRAWVKGWVYRSVRSSDGVYLWRLKPGWDAPDGGGGDHTP